MLTSILDILEKYLVLDIHKKANEAFKKYNEDIIEEEEYQNHDRGIYSEKKDRIRIDLQDKTESLYKNLFKMRRGLKELKLEKEKRRNKKYKKDKKTKLSKRSFKESIINLILQRQSLMMKNNVIRNNSNLNMQKIKEALTSQKINNSFKKILETNVLFKINLFNKQKNYSNNIDSNILQLPLMKAGKSNIINDNQKIKKDNNINSQVKHKYNNVNNNIDNNTTNEVTNNIKNNVRNISNMNYSYRYLDLSNKITSKIVDLLSSNLKHFFNINNVRNYSEVIEKLPNTIELNTNITIEIVSKNGAVSEINFQKTEVKVSPKINVATISVEQKTLKPYNKEYVIDETKNTTMLALLSNNLDFKKASNLVNFNISFELQKDTVRSILEYNCQKNEITNL